jgi:Flp pilus assembly protein TadD
VRVAVALLGSTIIGVAAAVSLQRRTAFADDLAFARAWAASNPRSATALTNLGNNLLERGDLAAAHMALRRALELKPDLADANYDLGVVLLRQGRPAEAVTQFALVQRLDASYPVHYNLALAQSHLEKRDEAIAAYKLATEHGADRSAAHYNLGLLLAERAEYSEALRHFQAAADQDRANSDAPYNVGVSLERMGRTNEAAAAYGETLRRRPEHKDAHFNLANLCFRSGRYRDAAAHYEAVFKLDPRDEQARRNLAAARSAAQTNQYQ